VESAPGAAVDVIIVNYRSYDELGRCLTSLEPGRAQLGHVVVVDHESDLEAASRITGRFPWVRLMERSTNEGFATGVNLGARQTGAPFFLLLNPDCIASPEAIALTLEYMDTRADAAIVGPRILDSDGTIQGSARRFPGVTTAIAGRSSWLTKRFPNNPLSRHNLPALEHRAEPLDVDWVSGACMLVRRAAFEQIGGMDEHFFLYWEDADLCRRLQLQGWRSVYFTGATIVHAGGRSSIHAFRESLAAFHHSALLLFRKHAPWPARLLTPLVSVGLHLRLQMLLYLYRHRFSHIDPVGSAKNPAHD